MPISGDIYLKQQPIDIMGSIERGHKMADLAREREVEVQQVNDQKALREAYNSNVDEAGNLNRNGYMASLAKAGLGQKAYESKREFATQDMADQTNQLKTLQTHLDTSTRLLNSATDQQSYTSVRNRAIEMKLATPEDMPEAYDPKWVAGKQNEALSYLEKLQNINKERQLDIDATNAETARFNATKKLGGKTSNADGSKAPAKMTEAQSKAVGFGRRAMLADQMVNQITDNPNADVSSLKTQAKMALPKWLGGMRDQREQALATSKLSFIASVLRKESGAAVSPQEFDQYDKMYYPQPGDTPETIGNKRTLRANFIDTEKMTAGSAWRDPIPFAPKAGPKPTGTPVPAPSAPRGPKHGTVVEGYVFMGGDPADERNWKKAK